MDIKNLWKNYKFPNCDKYKDGCGKYDYDNLCSNLNYLKNYGQEYFDRMKESFIELKNYIDFKPSNAVASVDDALFLAQSKIIENLNKEAPCVIVGRCSDVVLRNNPKLISIFVYSSNKEFKIERKMTNYNYFIYNLCLI